MSGKNDRGKLTSTLRGNQLWNVTQLYAEVHTLKTAVLLAVILTPWLFFLKTDCFTHIVFKLGFVVSATYRNRLFWLSSE